MMTGRLLVSRGLCIAWLALAAVACRRPEGPEPLPVLPTAVSTATLAPAASEAPPTPTLAPPSSIEAPATTTPPATTPPTATRPLASPTPSGPETIRFEPGGTTATIQGAVAPGQRREYRFRALAGQWATITIDSPGNAANFLLTGLADGQPYKRLENEDRQWTGALLLTQEFRLAVATAVTATGYTLTLTIPADLPPLPDTVPAIAGWLAQAQALGRPPGALQAVLRANGRLPETGGWEAVDLTGDGAAEWVVTLIDPVDLSPFGAAGDLAILAGGEVGYRYLARYPDNEATAPRLAQLVDMTGDGWPEAIVRREFCGAHTCAQAYDVVGTALGGVGSLLDPGPAGPPINMASSQLSFADRTGDGRMDLVLYGGFIGSAGAGPYQRGRTEIWAWDAGAERVTLAATALDPSNYRFHLLYEANDAFAAGETATAVAQYERVLNDATLEDGPGLEVADSSYDASRQFAAFRLLLIDTLADDAEAAAAWANWLGANYPAAPITQALPTFTETAAAGDVAAACAAVTARLALAANPTGPLANMGHALPSLTAEAVCPIAP